MADLASVDSKLRPGTLLHISAMAIALCGIAAPSWGDTAVRVQSPVTVTDVKNVVPGQGAPFAQWRARYVTLRHAPLNLNVLLNQSKVGATLPFWTSVVTSPLDGQSYTTSMVGGSPFAEGSKPNVNIPYVPIVARFHFQFKSGATFVVDPTKPACGDNTPIQTRFFNSPLFQPQIMTSNGVNVGAVQLENAFQRANFWKSVSGSGFGVTLTAARLPIVVDVNAPSGSGGFLVTIQCGKATKQVFLGAIDINQYDAIIQNLVTQHARPSQIPIVLTYNIVQTEGGGCCILGYHNAIPTSQGTQTYSVGSYVDSGIFSGVDDVVVWSHELGEWMDDPFVQAEVTGGGNDDLTPPWGNIGQVQGCQNNLEVGDPLSGTEFALPSPARNGFTYHFQDLAFEDWFYRTPAQGTSGKYSFQGVFTTTQGVCGGANF